MRGRRRRRPCHVRRWPGIPHPSGVRGPPGRRRRDPGARGRLRFRRTVHTAIQVPLVRVPDLEVRPTTRRPEPVLHDGHLRPLADHVSPGSDPRPAFELQAHARRLGERSLQGGCKVHRLDHHQTGAGLPSACRQPPEQRIPVQRHPLGQIGHQQLDRAPAQQGPGQPEALGRLGRPEHQQPGQVHAAGHRLERVEGTGEVQPGDDRAARLCLRDEPESQRGLAARRIPAERHLGSAHEPAGTQDGIECGEARGHDAVVGGGERVRGGVRDHERNRCEGTLDRQPHGPAITEPDRRTAPARLETRERCGQRFDRAVHHPNNDRTDVLYVNGIGHRIRSRATEDRGLEAAVRPWVRPVPRSLGQALAQVDRRPGSFGRTLAP